ncbi:acyl-CoA dehydrogenase [Rhodococcus rhodnii]|uniref:Acyl-CoA dehydrogenase n=2 Tax=Rhodococcus rhodnii TaxID=38312 RepID=R7WSE0_9NOCA|nr:acyl-CoA dehydrogenase family protein [Rhodococcus rhodnii]EOM76864.1 hypothetical protein Rrhod_1777 [Rhodococcus rhodnii LMG 5362]TXG89769.1 acyl-CoA dehydrogenase [Rhodococcus rhodnii]
MTVQVESRHDEQRELRAMLGELFARAEAAEPEALWKTLDELGLTRLTTPESEGGSGGTWHDAAVLLWAVGEHAVSLPIVENDLLASPLLAAAGMPSTPAVRTVALLDATGTAPAVAFARDAERIVAVRETGSGYAVADLERGDVDVTPGRDHAGEPSDRVVVPTTVSSDAWHAVDTAAVRALRYSGALARTVQIAGALDAITHLVVEHTTTRTQFGRPIARFQAVQFMAADIAAEAALARASAEAAIDAASRHGVSDDRTTFAIASAASVTGHAASLVARTAHQAFGAIGFTQEHSVHRYTTRALAWRSDFGSVRSWDDEVTARAVEAGRTGLWGLLTAT